MRMLPKLVVTLAALWLSSELCFGQTIAGSQKLSVQKLHDNFEDNAFAFERRCLIGQMHCLNLNPVIQSEPLSTTSDFIHYVDAAKRFRRHSALKETIQNGELTVLDWYTRIRDEEKIRGGFEFRDSRAPEETEVVYSLVPDFDPFDATVAYPLAIRRDQAMSGYFTRICDISKAIGYEEKVGGVLVTYQYNPSTTVEVLYPEKFGKMPAFVRWYANKNRKDSKTPNKTPPILVSETRSAWFDFDGRWAPYMIEVDSCNSIVGGKHYINESWKFEMKWVSPDRVTTKSMNETASAILWERLQAQKAN